MTLSQEVINSMPPEMADLYRNFPLWANISFATAVFAGLIGSIALVLRKAWAKPVLIISLIGVTLQQVYNVTSKAYDIVAPAAKILGPVIIIFAVGLIWFAHISIKRNWLK